MRVDILSVFPDMVRPALSDSMIGRACKNGILDIRYHNIRDHTKDKHRRTDDTPYGGGWGMVMTCQPVLDCHAAVVADSPKAHTIYMSPGGKVLTQKLAMKLAQYEHLVILCGHYEGVDQRVIDSVVDEEISIGDYVLTGGELPAAVLVDCVARLIPGVLPDVECHEDESIESGLLEYPQYTKPADYNGMAVPEVLLGGHHANIMKWRREKALEKTFFRRKDLLRKAKLTREERKYVEKLRATYGSRAHEPEKAVADTIGESKNKD